MWMCHESFLPTIVFSESCNLLLELHEKSTSKTFFPPKNCRNVFNVFSNKNEKTNGEC